MISLVFLFEACLYAFSHRTHGYKGCENSPHTKNQILQLLEVAGVISTLFFVVLAKYANPKPAPNEVLSAPTHLWRILAR
jgi:hypothetical protein